MTFCLTFYILYAKRTTLLVYIVFCLLFVFLSTQRTEVRMDNQKPCKLSQSDVKAIETVLNRRKGHAEVFVGKDGTVRVYDVRREHVEGVKS